MLEGSPSVATTRTGSVYRCVTSTSPARTVRFRLARVHGEQARPPRDRAVEMTLAVVGSTRCLQAAGTQEGIHPAARIRPTPGRHAQLLGAIRTAVDPAEWMTTRGESRYSPQRPLPSPERMLPVPPAWPVWREAQSWAQAWKKPQPGREAQSTPPRVRHAMRAKERAAGSGEPSRKRGTARPVAPVAEWRAGGPPPRQ